MSEEVQVVVAEEPPRLETPEVGNLGGSKRQLANGIEDIPQSVLRNQIRETDIRRPAEKPVADANLTVQPEDKLTHRELVEVHVEERGDRRSGRQVGKPGHSSSGSVLCTRTIPARSKSA